MVAAAASSAEGVPFLSTTPCANACSLAAASAPDESVKLPLSRLQLSVSNKARCPACISMLALKCCYLLQQPGYVSDISVHEEHVYASACTSFDSKAFRASKTALDAELQKASSKFEPCSNHIGDQTMYIRHEQMLCCIC